MSNVDHCDHGVYLGGGDRCEYCAARAKSASALFDGIGTAQTEPSALKAKTKEELKAALQAVVAGLPKLTPESAVRALNSLGYRVGATSAKQPYVRDLVEEKIHPAGPPFRTFAPLEFQRGVEPEMVTMDEAAYVGIDMGIEYERAVVHKWIDDMYDAKERGEGSIGVNFTTDNEPVMGGAAMEQPKILGVVQMSQSISLHFTTTQAWRAQEVSLILRQAQIAHEKEKP